MAGVVLNTLAGKNDQFIGKYEHPINALIENESNQCLENKYTLDFLFNVEKSKNGSEAIIAQNDFNNFDSVIEGGESPVDEISAGFKKVISHIEFKKQFAITRVMMDDAKIGAGVSLGINARQKPKNFVRAYYATRNAVACAALSNGTATSVTLQGGQRLDLTVGDGLALFSNAHTYSNEDYTGETQSNKFWGNVSADVAEFETALGQAAIKMRNFKDENKRNLNYVADTVIIPCNRAGLEIIAKKIIGSEKTPGSANNAINTQFGNWTLVVLDGWEAAADEFIVMSSEANKALLGNLFFDRTDLEIDNEVDKSTKNLIWYGYARLGCGFGNWKHIAIIKDAATAAAGYTALA